MIVSPVLTPLKSFNPLILDGFLYHFIDSFITMMMRKYDIGLSCFSPQTPFVQEKIPLVLHELKWDI